MTSLLHNPSWFDVTLPRKWRGNVMLHSITCHSWGSDRTVGNNECKLQRAGTCKPLPIQFLIIVQLSVGDRQTFWVATTLLYKQSNKIINNQKFTTTPQKKFCHRQISSTLDALWLKVDMNMIMCCRWWLFCGCPRITTIWTFHSQLCAQRILLAQYASFPWHEHYMISTLRWSPMHEVCLCIPTCLSIPEL